QSPEHLLRHSFPSLHLHDGPPLTGEVWNHSWDGEGILKMRLCKRSSEWGHAFWFVDELFSAPLHWGFVTLGWCGLFASAGGVAAQIISRMSNLADVIWNNAPKSILDPFSSQLSGGAKIGGY
ncbi:MAG TPA: methane monooxygenase/ammonia monooxygenase subunit C, partial [Nitrospira sp.]|nr:methane monooxygenase/ammonia monooxygenase subunit C [Nitrospira sp.]